MKIEYGSSGSSCGKNADFVAHLVDVCPVNVRNDKQAIPWMKL